MTLDGYTLTELEQLWHATFDAWEDLRRRMDQLSEDCHTAVWHSPRWHELASQIDVLISAWQEHKELCEAIRAEIDRRPVDA